MRRIRSQIYYRTVVTFLWAIYHDLPRCDCCGMLELLRRVTTAMKHPGGFCDVRLRAALSKPAAPSRAPKDTFEPIQKFWFLQIKGPSLTFEERYALANHKTRGDDSPYDWNEGMTPRDPTRDIQVRLQVIRHHHESSFQSEGESSPRMRACYSSRVNGIPLNASSARQMNRCCPISEHRSGEWLHSTVPGRHNEVQLRPHRPMAVRRSLLRGDYQSGDGYRN